MNNDEKLKKMIDAVNVPIELEPENIKKMLDNESYTKNCNKKPSYTKKYIRIISGLAACGVLSTVGIYYVNSNAPTKYDSFSNITSTTKKDTFPDDSYGKVYALFGDEKYFETGKATGILGVDTDAVVYGEAVEEAMPENSLEMSDGASQDFSETYNQEENVEESDKALTDGKNIFHISNSQNINITTVENGIFQQAYTINMTELVQFQSDEFSFSIQQMYLTDDNCLAVISSGYNYSKSLCTNITVFDVSNMEETGSPVYLGGYTQDGSFNDVRMIGDYIYLISNYQSQAYSEVEGEEDYASYIPSFTTYYGENEESSEFIEACDIILPETPKENQYSISYTTISGIKLNTEEKNNTDEEYTPVLECVDSKSLVQYSGNIYCSQNNLYTVSGYDNTEITRFEISDGLITESASAEVKGSVLNQFSMSEYNGYFRIATSHSGWEETISEFEGKEVAQYSQVSEENNFVYVLDMDLNVVGSISDFGINETIKSVNFSQNLAYVVTYEQTDPLFAIDLSVPENPVILDEYKINGYSTYMQKWSDTLMLGFGIEADDNGIETGIKLVMFDISDPNELKEVGKTSKTFDPFDSIESIYSPAVYDRKALLIAPEKNIIGVPYNHNTIDTDGNYVTLGKYVFYSYENGSFTELCEISRPSVFNMDRALYIGNYVYILSESEFISIDMSNFIETDSYVF